MISFILISKIVSMVVFPNITFECIWCVGLEKTTVWSSLTHTVYKQLLTYINMNIYQHVSTYKTIYSHILRYYHIVRHILSHSYWVLSCNITSSLGLTPRTWKTSVPTSSSDRGVRGERFEVLEQTIRAKGDTLLATLLDDPQHDAMPEICVEGNKQLGSCPKFLLVDWLTEGRGYPFNDR